MDVKLLYVSKTGFTKQYAAYIADKLKLQAIEYKKGDFLRKSDNVIFCSFVFGGNITELTDIRNEVDQKNIRVLACGIVPPSSEVINQLAKENHFDADQIYYVPGGLDYSKLNFLKKSILKMVKGSLEKKAVRSTDEEETLRRLNVGGSFVDFSYCDALIKDYLNER